MAQRTESILLGLIKLGGDILPATLRQYGQLDLGMLGKRVDGSKIMHQDGLGLIVEHPMIPRAKSIMLYVMHTGWPCLRSCTVLIKPKALARDANEVQRTLRTLQLII